MHPSVRLLTFEAFACNRDWFRQWLKTRPWNGALFVDRSPCSDPFLDPTHVGQPNHLPTIGHLCRPNLGRQTARGDAQLQKGDRRIYVVRVDQRIIRDPKLQTALQEHTGRWPSLTSYDSGLYAIVADLEVQDTFPSHQAAEKTFTQSRDWIPRQPHMLPPNLQPSPDHAAPVDWCVSYDPTGQSHYAPNDLRRDCAWETNVQEYAGRAAWVTYACCRARFIDVHRPPVVTGAELLQLLKKPDGTDPTPRLPAGGPSGRPIRDSADFWARVSDRRCLDTACGPSKPAASHPPHPSQKGVHVAPARTL